jgi:hypothetical protein
MGFNSGFKGLKFSPDICHKKTHEDSQFRAESWSQEFPNIKQGWQCRLWPERQKVRVLFLHSIFAANEWFTGWECEANGRRLQPISAVHRMGRYREILPNLTSNARAMFLEASSRMNLGAFGCPVLADNKQLGNQLLILLNDQLLTLPTS